MNNSPNQDDDFLEKAKYYTLQTLDKTTQLAKETYTKVDQKYHDPQFQQDLQNFKENVEIKGKQFGNATVDISVKTYEVIKEGVGTGWKFLQSKYLELKSDDSSQQRQLSLKEELLKPEEKERTD